eukprot:1844797-Pleurochrysis_carterae.AAC.1
MRTRPSAGASGVAGGLRFDPLGLLPAAVCLARSADLDAAESNEKSLSCIHGTSSADASEPTRACFKG